MTEFLAFLVVGIGTYLSRASFILVLGSQVLPPWAERMLRNVGPAVLAALVTSLLLTDGLRAFVSDGPRLVGVAVAIVASAVTKRFVWAFALGMAAFWIAGAL